MFWLEREAEAGLPGGSRDLLSLQGGHAGNDTSAHTHYTRDRREIQGGKALVPQKAFSEPRHDMDARGFPSSTPRPVCGFFLIPRCPTRMPITA